MSFRLIEGKGANGGQLESCGWELIEFLDGPHAGHQAEVVTEKFNCGAFREDIQCSCGKSYKYPMNGCWQQGHQRRESGDATLRLSI